MKKYLIILSIIAAPWYLIAQSMDIGTGASTTIGVGASISVGTAASSGTVTTAATSSLVIESDANGTGSLICGGTPNATVKRYVIASRWNMVTPSTSGTTGQTFFDASGSDSWLVEFDESAGTGSNPGTGWTYIIDLSTSTPLGTGYSYYPSVNETVEFIGNLNTSDFSPTLAFTSSDKGYNPLGNPFTSALLWDNSWSFSNMEGTIWIYNGTQYQSYTAATTFNIPVGQGFFMKANASGPSVTIPASKRVHNSQAFLKSGTQVKSNYENYLVLTALNNQYSDKIQVSFSENGTEDFDNGWDGSKMFGESVAPQLYVRSNAAMLSYNHLPTLNTGQERIVDLGYVPGADGAQMLTADVSNLNIEYVLLEDMKTGVTHSFIGDNQYEFMGSKDDDPNRFRLKFSHTAFGIGEDASLQSDIKIYAVNKEIFVRSMNDMKHFAGQIFIHDLNGRTLLKKDISSGELISLTFPLSNRSFLIVKVIKNNTVTTEKVFLQ